MPFESALHILTHLILANAANRKSYYYCHFRDEGTGTETLSHLTKNDRASKHRAKRAVGRGEAEH